MATRTSSTFRRSRPESRATIRRAFAVACAVAALPWGRFAEAAPTWAKSFGTSAATTRILGTAVDAAGNVFVVGSFTGASLDLGGTSLVRVGTQDAFLAKFDRDGALVFARDVGGAGATIRATSVAVDGSGHVFVTGAVQGALTVPRTAAAIGTVDAFVARWAAGGDDLWVTRFGGAGASLSGTGIALDSTGVPLVAATLESSGATTPPLTRRGVSDAVLLKLAGSGAVTWARNYGGALTGARSTAVATDASGNAVLVGTFDFSDMTTPALGRLGSPTSFVIKVDTGGVTAWARAVGGGLASSTLTSVTSGAAGEVTAGGTTSFVAMTSPPLARVGLEDGIVIRYDASGTLAWAKALGGPTARARVDGVTLGASGDAVVGGSFASGDLATPPLDRHGATASFRTQLTADAGAVRDPVTYFGSGAAEFETTGIARNGNGALAMVGTLTGAGPTPTTPPLARFGTVDAFLICEGCGAVDGGADAGDAGADASDAGDAGADASDGSDAGAAIPDASDGPDGSADASDASDASDVGDASGDSDPGDAMTDAPDADGTVDASLDATIPADATIADGSPGDTGLPDATIADASVLDGSPDRDAMGSPDATDASDVDADPPFDTGLVGGGGCASGAPTSGGAVPFAFDAMAVAGLVLLRRTRRRRP
ncbi:MAG: hypothetical protein U0169_08225 [Polyangiaceae bacterium]